MPDAALPSTSPAPQPAADNFDAFPLRRALRVGLQNAGYVCPTPIQAAFMPPALQGLDVIGKAQTGTGKTAAFLLPLMQYIDPTVRAPQALVLGPTRELVMQIANEGEKLKGTLPIRVLPILGGEQYHGQLSGLREGAHLIVGTPGRVIDHIDRRTLRLERIDAVVLDEADRMLDIGFRPDIEKILRRCPRDRQTLLLSATLSPEVTRLAHRYMIDPITVDVNPEDLTVASIRQSYFTVDQQRKLDLLQRVLQREQPAQCIIFCRTKRGADKLFERLRGLHRKVAVLHGDLPQQKRSRIMQAFRAGTLPFLVATDVVARGIDVTDISHIINYDLPEDPESYVHRIGRTGRMGRAGVAISFVTPAQGKELTAIEMLQEQLIPEDRIEGFVAAELLPEPPPGETPTEEEAPPPAPPKPRFGRRQRRYYRGL
jgi:ATP-dependent RNA helicase DeaD